MTTAHQVAEADKHRIKCTDDRWHQGCTKPADVCHYIGGGFYYFCDEHSQLHIAEAAKL